MAIVVEHDKRRKEILQKSMDVFVSEGYEDVTFQKIADRCGITRTTLYIYFKNKQEIFLGSIKELLSTVESQLTEFINNESLASEECLRKSILFIVTQCFENQKLFKVLLSYLLQLEKSGVDINQKVQRRIVRVRHHLSTILIRGMQRDEFKKINVHDFNELVYSLIESAIFKLTVLHQDNIDDINVAFDIAITNILINK